jgi:hypothetical protein
MDKWGDFSGCLDHQRPAMVQFTVHYRNSLVLNSYDYGPCVVWGLCGVCQTAPEFS